MEAIRRNSKKRAAIYDVLCSTTAHPSAEQIYSALKPSIPDLSLGTVYRNLALLADSGLIISVGHVRGEERYDARTDCHPHFVCTRCGRVLDVELEGNGKMDYSDIERRSGVKVAGHTLSFYGVCDECVRQGKLPL